MRKLCLLSTSVAALLITIPLAAHATVIPAGTDYFITQPGTSDNIPGIGVVDFLGVSFGPGGADTIIQRLADATINGPPIPIQITGLQLVSTNWMALGLPFPIYVSLDLNQLANDTGTMTIDGTAAGGTFDSTLNVYFDICTAVGVNGAGCGAGTELGTGSLLGGTSTMTPWAAIDGLPFVPLTTKTCWALSGCHIVDPIPEPGTLALLGSALLGLVGVRNRRRRR